MMDGGMMGAGTGWWMVVSVLSWILVIVGVVFLVVWVVQKGPVGGRGGTEESALEILKKRYARGEISLEEFEERKRHIG